MAVEKPIELEVIIVFAMRIKKALSYFEPSLKNKCTKINFYVEPSC